MRCHIIPIVKGHELMQQLAVERKVILLQIVGGRRERERERGRGGRGGRRGEGEGEGGEGEEEKRGGEREGREGGRGGRGRGRGRHLLEPSQCTAVHGSLVTRHSQRQH